MNIKHSFISHSTKNKDIVDNIVKNLEDNGIPCWVAPRNINAGTNYGAAISSGIRECGVFVLVYSEHSNVSEAVFREVQLAFECRKPIIPVRINNVPVSDDLNFFLSGIQWVDANPEQLQFDKLVDDILRLLNVSPTPPPYTEGETELLTPNSYPTITLRNIENPSQFWTVDLSNEVTIGRLPVNNIHLAESSVSREQCKLYATDTDIIIKNSSVSNITQLNGKPLNNPSTLQCGDIIKCGRIVLVVE